MSSIDFDSRRHRRELSGNALRRFAERHGEFISQVLGAAGANGRRVTFFDDIRAVRDLFLGVKDTVNRVYFPDINGEMHHEFDVSLHPTGVLVNSADARHSARPTSDGFALGDHKPASKRRIWDLHHNVAGQDVRDGTAKWYSGLNTCIFGGRINGPHGRLLDFLCVQPDQMAWMGLAWDIIHSVVPVDELLSERFEPEAVVVSGIGLREPMFEGAHRTFICRDQAKLTMVCLSHYEGTSGPKKPTGFGTLQHFLMKDGGVMTHANVVAVIDAATARRLPREELFRLVDALQYSGARNDEIALVIEWFARSGHKKSELGYDTRVHDGRAVLVKDVLVRYLAEKRPRLIIGGDDGIGRRSLATAEDARTVFQTEQGGRFERNTGHREPKNGAVDDYPEVTAYLENCKWWQCLVLNHEAKPGEPIIGWEQRVFDGKTTLNPRVNMQFDLLNKLGNSYTSRPMRIDYRAYGIGTLMNWAPWKPWNRLPSGLAFVNAMVGLCKAKSASVVGGQSNEVIADWGETIGGFCFNSMAELINRFAEMYAALGDSVDHFVVPVGYIGPNHIQPHGDEAQHIFRDGLLFRETGDANWEDENSPSFLCGRGPAWLEFFGQRIDCDVFSPYAQYGETDYFRVVRKIHRFFCETFRQFRASGELSPEAERMLSIYEESDPTNSRPDYLEQVWNSFSRWT